MTTAVKEKMLTPEIEAFIDEWQEKPGNLIMILLGLEIMLNAAAIAFVGAALRWGHLEGQVMAIFILASAAAEVSIGLALIVCAYRRMGTVDPGAYNPK